MTDEIREVIENDTLFAQVNNIEYLIEHIKDSKFNTEQAKYILGGCKNNFNIPETFRVFRELDITFSDDFGELTIFLNFLNQVLECKPFQTICTFVSNQFDLLLEENLKYEEDANENSKFKEKFELLQKQNDELAQENMEYEKILTDAENLKDKISKLEIEKQNLSNEITKIIEENNAAMKSKQEEIDGYKNLQKIKDEFANNKEKELEEANTKLKQKDEIIADLLRKVEVGENKISLQEEEIMKLQRAQSDMMRNGKPSNGEVSKIQINLNSVESSRILTECQKDIESLRNQLYEQRQISSEKDKEINEMRNQIQNYKSTLDTIKEGNEESLQKKISDQAKTIEELEIQKQFYSRSKNFHELYITFKKLAAEGNTKVIEYSKDRGFSYLMDPKETFLTTAAYDNDFVTAKALVEAGMDANFCNADGVNAAWIFHVNNNQPAVEFFKQQKNFNSSILQRPLLIFNPEIDCSFIITRDVPSPSPELWCCLDCSDEYHAICTACKNRCHKGHNVIKFNGTKAYCTCGSGILKNHCTCMKRKNALQQHEIRY